MIEKELDEKHDSPSGIYGSSFTKQNEMRASRIEVIATADDKINLTEPSTPSHAQYPFCQSYQSLSGHLQEIDDTPGAERILTQHKSGTFEEIHPDGTKVTKIFGDDFYIVLDDHLLFVGGNLNITVQGNANLLVKDNLKVKVGGDMETTVQGNMITRVKGETIHYSTGKIDYQTEDDIIYQTAKEMTLKSKTKTTISSDTQVDVLGKNKVLLSSDRITAIGKSGVSFSSGINNIGVSDNITNITSRYVNIRATEEMTLWADGENGYFNGYTKFCKYRGVNDKNEPTPPSIDSPVDTVDTAIVDNTMGLGLNIPDSVIEPSIENLYISKTGNSNLISSIETITYPKDRIKMTT